jgi:hypothetical protein
VAEEAAAEAGRTDDAPAGSRRVRRGVNLTKIERFVSVAGGTLALLVGLVGGGATAYRAIFPEVPWRTAADDRCLKYIDEYAAGSYEQLDETRLLEMWLDKYRDLQALDVPVEYQLDWRAYLHAEGDLLSHVDESWDDTHTNFDRAALAYGGGTSLESLKTYRELSAKLNLHVCGHEMDQTSSWIALRLAVGDDLTPTGR